jgi:hypothetical protein
MNQMKTARGERHSKPKVLHHIEVHKGENGGHLITHHFDNGLPGEGYHEPEMHPFGKDEGTAALSHIATTMEIKRNESDAGEAEGEPNEGNEVEA